MANKSQEVRVEARFLFYIVIPSDRRESRNLFGFISGLYYKILKPGGNIKQIPRLRPDDYIGTSLGMTTIKMINKLKTKYALESIAFAFVFMVLAVPVLASEITAKKVIELVNIERQKANLASLSESDSLSRVAEAKAKDMIQKNYFAHTSPEGKTPWSFFEKEKYDYRYAGENLAINFVSAEKQMDAWMKSETHKKNILNQNFSEIGVAVAAGKIDGKEAIITVQEFGTPSGVLSRQEKKETPAYSKEYDFSRSTKAVPIVLSEKSASLAREKGRSGWPTWKLNAIEVSQTLLLFVSFVALTLAPMAFLAKAFEKMWILWETRARRVRVRYVN